MSGAAFRAKVAAAVTQVAAQYAEECIEGIMEIARDKKNVFPSDRLKAYDKVLERAAGKATQVVESEGDASETFIEKLRAAREAAQQTMQEAGSNVPALPKPVERPMGNVVDLRPLKRDGQTTYAVAKRPRKRIRIPE